MGSCLPVRTTCNALRRKSRVAQSSALLHRHSCRCRAVEAGTNAGPASRRLAPPVPEPIDTLAVEAQTGLVAYAALGQPLRTWSPDTKPAQCVRYSSSNEQHHVHSVGGPARSRTFQTGVSSSGIFQAASCDLPSACHLRPVRRGPPRGVRITVVRRSQLRPYSQQYWRERQIRYAAEQKRKRKIWIVVGAFLTMVFLAAVFTVSMTSLPEDEGEDIIITGE